MSNRKTSYEIIIIKMIFFCQKERTAECINKAMHAWKLDIQQLKTIISGKRVDYLLNGLGTTYYTTGIK